MFGFFKKKSKGELEAGNLSSAEELDQFIKNNPSEVTNLVANKKFLNNLLCNPKTVEACGLVLNKNALDGNVQCQELISQMTQALAINTTDPNALKPLLEKIIKFGRLAANNGSKIEMENLPKSLGRLAGLLVEQNGGTWCDDSIDNINESYQWYLKIVGDQRFNSKEKNFANASSREYLQNFGDILT
jgi:hypothetical protein